MKHRKTKTRAIDIPDGIDLVEQEPQVPRHNVTGFSCRPFALVLPAAKTRRSLVLFYN